MKILIITDTWKPQINGVVRTIEGIERELTKMGNEVHVIGPETGHSASFSLPTYPEIKLEFFAHSRLSRIIYNFAPDYIHIATEGPLGWAARGICLRNNKFFTTCYHTRFPEYVAHRVPAFMAPYAKNFAYFLLRRFHAPSGAVMVATASVEKILQEKNFKNLTRWTRGVDAACFNPSGKKVPPYFEKLPRPILLYVGRIAVEKNVPAFLGLKTTGSKVVIGDGPDFAFFKKHHPDVHFFGAKTGAELADCFAGADLFVFPSRTDTFGLVLLEACASGLRVAAYPAPGPRDIFASEKSKMFAVLDKNLQTAVDKALALPIDPERPRAYASGFSWTACTAQFLKPFETYKPKKTAADEAQAEKPPAPKKDWVKIIRNFMGF